MITGLCFVIMIICNIFFCNNYYYTRESVSGQNFGIICDENEGRGSYVHGENDKVDPKVVDIAPFCKDRESPEGAVYMCAMSQDTAPPTTLPSGYNCNPNDNPCQNG